MIVKTDINPTRKLVKFIYTKLLFRNTFFMESLSGIFLTINLTQ